MNSDVIIPVIPEKITVHLGRPNEPAMNVTVPFADYIKNVASSEIYPTWNENAIRANILAEISFALNRIYTEYYLSRGYDFDITNSISIDQSYVYGRDIFENISNIVDELFNDYIARQGSVEPLFALYCDGIEVSCNGLSQWGSQQLAEQGYTPYEILQYYYNNNINIIRNAPVAGIEGSYPGAPLRLGSVGDNVLLLQNRLNRISRNYPGIPKIPNPAGFFNAETDEAVRAFQNQFELTVDGVVGKATWYAIARIYGGVKRLTDVNSEGIPLSDVTLIFRDRLSEGSTGLGVRELQTLLSYISLFNPAVRSTAIDGIFGRGTRLSVEDFQREYGISVTGEVDKETFDTIVSVFQTYRDSLPPNAVGSTTATYPGTPLRLGSSGNDVVTLQNYLNRISDIYTAIPKLNVDGVYGIATQRAILEYQRIFGLEETGVTASVTWNSIADTYRTITDGTRGSETQFGGTLSGAYL